MPVNLSTFVMTLIGIASGVMLGVFVSRWVLNRQKAARLQVPTSWPLVARGLVTPPENEVCKWLRATFPDHLVMIKVPVLRFTVPMDGERLHDVHWLDLLRGVYTTFTVCTEEGAVVGCVDVPGVRDMGRANRQLKEAVLSACGIAYTVVRSTNLPGREAMRAAFLGEIAGDFQIEIHSQQKHDNSLAAELAAFSPERLRERRAASQRPISQHVDEAVQLPPLPAGEMQPSRFDAGQDHSPPADPIPRPARPE